MPDRCFGKGGSAEHASHFFGALVVAKETDRGSGAALLLVLLDQEMLVGERGDLRQVRHAEDLLGAGERLELLTHGFGGSASDADVDFVEDEGAGDLDFAGFGTIGPLLHADFEGEQDAGHFSA